MKGMQSKGEVKKSVNKPLDVESQIRTTAYYLSQKKLSYNDLCWILAEKQLNILKAGRGSISKEEIKKKSEEIFKKSIKYDDLCWFIAKIDVTKQI
jgi:hypothetical protein